MPFLAIDIGNTRLKWALYPHAAPGAEPIAAGAEFLENIDKLADGEWSGLAAPERMLGTGPARPMVVVMIGTAVTVEAIDASGKFLGGLILPGHGIMLRALESGTAGLHVPTGEVREFPTNTSDALTSGGTYAIAGAVERMVQHVRSHCGAEPACYMTGGAGWKMAPVMNGDFELVESLIMDGLLVIARERASE